MKILNLFGITDICQDKLYEKKVITSNYLISFLEKLDIRHKRHSDEITHGSLDSQIMRKYLVNIVIKTMLFLIFLIVSGRI